MKETLALKTFLRLLFAEPRVRLKNCVHSLLIVSINQSERSVLLIYTKKLHSRPIRSQRSNLIKRPVTNLKISKFENFGMVVKIQGTSWVPAIVTEFPSSTDPVLRIPIPDRRIVHNPHQSTLNSRQHLL